MSENLFAYDPLASSLTRQAWEWQEKVIDMMGEGLGDAPTPTAPFSLPALPPAAESALERAGLDQGTLKACGTGLAAAAFAGFVAGRVGVLPTLAGVGLAYVLLKNLDRQ
jgi:hypothetical protein